MENIKNTIEEVYNLMQEWNILNLLTEKEKDVIKARLRDIASTAIMESSKAIVHILPSMYGELIKK